MAKKKGSDSETAFWVWPIMALLLVGALWALNWLAAPGNDPAAMGQFGDKFGAVNALFSGLAFAGIIYTLVLQRKDLQMQREEMRMQRDEMEKSRQEFEEQNFQNIFFGLMRHQQELRDRASVMIHLMSFSIHTEGWQEKLVQKQGLDAFLDLEREVRLVNVVLQDPRFVGVRHGEVQEGVKWALDHLDETQTRTLIEQVRVYRQYGLADGIHARGMEMDAIGRARLAYAIVLDRYGRTLGPYFRHLYNVLRYLSQAKQARIAALSGLAAAEKETRTKAISADFHRFGRFLQANMNPSELFLCLVNALNFEKAMALVVEFRFVDNLDEAGALGIKSGEIPGVNFKNHRSILERALEG